jgi:phage terminase Nu1 subunit (DNA packaging protein)
MAPRDLYYPIVIIILSVVIMDELTGREIEELVARFPLAAGVPDAVLNRSELADFFEVSMLTISNWITAGMPVKTKGGHGQAYELQLSECWAWKCARDRNEEMRSEQARAAIEAQRLNLVGGGMGETIEALDPKTRREIMAAQREFELLEAHRNRLMRREDVLELLNSVFGILQDTVDAMPDLVERQEGVLSATAADAVERIGDLLIENVRLKVERWIEERPVAPRSYFQEQPDLFEAAGDAAPIGTSTA